MCLTEYNEEEVMELFKEEGREEGIEEGMKKGREEGRKDGREEGLQDLEKAILLYRSGHNSLEALMKMGVSDSCAKAAIRIG